MARRTRQVPQDVRNKIAASLKGRQISDETRQRMSDAQRAAWARVPQNINNDEKETTEIQR